MRSNANKVACYALHRFEIQTRQKSNTLLPTNTALLYTSQG